LLSLRFEKNGKKSNKKNISELQKQLFFLYRTKANLQHIIKNTG
jgi:hypothetical protein